MSICSFSIKNLKEENMENQEVSNENVKVKVIPGGPLMVTGTCEITHVDGTVEVKENKTTYCRCALSKNKPFCDGSHKGTNWDS